jgi:prepilin-type N-terminal cleavage/methylation domain-containing protein
MMEHKMGKRNVYREGFTLVELLVVITIIAILTIITVSQFQTARKKASDGQRKADLNSLSKALQMYYADYGSFPVSDDGFLTYPAGGSLVPISWGEEFHDGATPPYVYMKVLPKENASSPYPPFCYVTDPGGSMYGLFAMLENTDDKQCVMDGTDGEYSHCGENYCYSVVSPNIVVTDLAGYVN